jgi:PEP-CTERM motif
MSLRTRFSAFGFALATILIFQGLAQASYTYTSVVTPDPITSASGLSQVTFSSISGGPIPIDNTLQPLRLTSIHATSSATTPESIASVTILDTVTIFDGGQTGVFTFHFTLSASNVSSTTVGNYSIGVPFFSTHKIVVNGDTFTCNQFNMGVIKTNGVDALYGTDITAIPAAVPEPSSLLLMGIAGAALLAARPLRSLS